VRNEEGTTIAKQDDAPARETREACEPSSAQVEAQAEELRADAGLSLPQEETSVHVEQQLKALEEENSDLKDKFLRKAADFENFRKRMFREREEAVLYANSALLTDLIGTIDDFERAIRSARESRNFSAFLSGVELIEKQLLEKLERNWHLKRFPSQGEPFDPNRHEAVLRLEGDTEAPVVLEEFERGYFLNERVLRAAKVKVLVPGAGVSPADAAESSEAVSSEKAQGKKN
jgi:molecular chaperone GrpE